MIRRIRPIFRLLLAATVLSVIPSIVNAAVLDIGTDYRMRWISLNRADYGLTDGQNVVAEGQSRLQSGTRVTVRETTSPAPQVGSGG